MAINKDETLGNSVPALGDIPPKVVFILGNGGFARELGYYFSTTFSSLILYVDEVDTGKDIITHQKYLELMKWNTPGFVSIMGSGRPEIKINMLDQIKGAICTYIHPQSTVLGKIGEGSVVAPGAVVAPNVVVGKHVLINYCASVGHDTVVEDLAVISPNSSVGGKCIIGRGAYIGAGTNIRENLKIGTGAMIGMGAVVTKNIPAGVTAIGVPARW